MFVYTLNGKEVARSSSKISFNKRLFPSLADIEPVEEKEIKKKAVKPAEEMN